MSDTSGYVVVIPINLGKERREQFMGIGERDNEFDYGHAEFEVPFR